MQGRSNECHKAAAVKMPICLVCRECEVPRDGSSWVVRGHSRITLVEAWGVILVEQRISKHRDWVLVACRSLLSSSSNLRYSCGGQLSSAIDSNKNTFKYFCRFGHGQPSTTEEAFLFVPPMAVSFENQSCGMYASASASTWLSITSFSSDESSLN